MSEIKIHPLQRARKRLGIKQKVLADLTGLSEATIKRAERGEPLNLYTIAQICEYFSRRYSRQIEPEELGLSEKSAHQENVSTDEVKDINNEKITFHDHSISLPPQPYFAHPYPLQENFTGRVHEREMLTGWLNQDKYPILALVALGGMGKSSLAWTWLQEEILNLAEAARPHGILWWSFYETEATFASFINQALVYTSNGNVNTTNITSIYEKTQTLLTLLQQQRFLLVLDGFERELRAYSDLAVAHEEHNTQGDMQEDFRVCTDPHMSSFLRWLAASPPSSKLLLITRLFSRELDGLVGCRREELSSLKAEDAMAFLNSQGIHGMRNETEALCKMYGNHPLALRLLSGLIVNDPASPGDISVASDYSPLAHLIQRKHHILSLAYVSLRQPLRQFISQLAAFRSKINFEMAKVVNPFRTEKELKGALQELVQRGLLFFSREQRYYEFHPIVRQYAYSQLVQKESTHACLVEYFWSKAGRSFTAEMSEPTRKIRAFVVEPPPNGQAFEEHVEDFTLVIELCYHMIHAKQLENAFGIYYKHLASPLYHRLGAYQVVIELLQAFISHSEEALLPLDSQKQSWLLDAIACL